MLMSYMETMDTRFRAMFANVHDGRESVDDAVAFLLEEMRTSFKRGVATGSKPRRKTTSPQRENVATGA